MRVKYGKHLTECLARVSSHLLTAIATIQQIGSPPGKPTKETDSLATFIHTPAPCFGHC